MALVSVIMPFETEEVTGMRKIRRDILIDDEFGTLA